MEGLSRLWQIFITARCFLDTGIMEIYASCLNRLRPAAYNKLVARKGGFFMRDVFFMELRDCCRGIQGMEKSSAYYRERDMIVETIELLVELSNTTRKSGLLGLEDRVNRLGDINNGDILKEIVILVVDGTDPELVDEICTLKYFANDFKVFDALQYLMIQMGVLSMQAGDNPRIIEEKLLSIIPKPMEEEYLKRREKKKKEEESRTQAKELSKSHELYFQGGIAADPEEPAYYLVKAADYAIRSLRDRDLQRLLRDVDNNDLAVAMMVLSGEARRHIFNNTSERLADMLAEDMEFMGRIRLADSEAAIAKIFNIILKLMEYEEIHSDEYEAFKLFGTIFKESPEEERSRIRKEESETEMIKLMRDYTNRSNKIITCPWV